MSKRIVCWVGDAPNHRALVNKIAAQFGIAGVVVDTKRNLKRTTGLLSFWKKLLNKLQFGKIDNAWSAMQQYYRQQFPHWPAAKLLKVDSINSIEAFEFTKALQPDLVIVSGTSLIKEPMVSMSMPIGILNLHTGLSPYVKGGPNCTNWCIANDEWHLIGNTIMWLSAGIDSGNIIASERTELKSTDDLPAIHLKVMEHAHELYLRAIRYVLEATPPYQSVPQAGLGKGNLYLTKMWTGAKKRTLLRNMSSSKNRTRVSDIKIIRLPS